MNGKVAFLILGLLIGGVAGYVTRPEAAQIKIGGASIEFSDNKVSTGSADSLTSGQTQHILFYAAIGGIVGLLAGFAVGSRR